MLDVLRFGILSLDELLGSASENRFGIRLLERNVDPVSATTRPGKGPKEISDRILTTSVCIIGANGAGKSIFALHMASKYLADCIASEEKLPSVIYVSTDLTHEMAKRAWDNFALGYPFLRKDPFSPSVEVPKVDVNLNIELEECDPTSLEKDFDVVERNKERVTFVDIASYTAGDDWGFLHKLISLLRMPADDQAPRHLLVLDAIEGFEALAGDLNAFGERSTRRSRIAQVMRLAARKCHVLLVVEESQARGQNEDLAEQYVADTVIKLENLSAHNYDRRVLRVEKVRGQSHIRGHHHYSIRSGGGSTTGFQTNADDPELKITLPGDNKETTQSYIHVYHSVHRLNRRTMEDKGKPRQKLNSDYYAAFGIKYLDNMLGGREETTIRRQGTDRYKGYFYDTRGLPCASTTTLIGDSLTQKSTLGKAFLSRCFHSFDERLTSVCESLEKSKERADEIFDLAQRKVSLLSPVKVSLDREATLSLIKSRDWNNLSGYLFEAARLPELPLAGGLSKKEQVTHFASWLMDYRGGVAVMFVTHNTHREALVNEFVGWLHSKTELDELNHQRAGYQQALERYIKDGTICRRLEIHSLSSEVLVHIIKQTIWSAQRRLLTSEEMRLDDKRFEGSWPVRLVIDDLSTLRDIFPELHEDPFLLPSILFHFEREGITTLIVDTQSGRPDTPIAERFENELRKMVQHNLYTWRVPFFGESRIAITAIPPLSAEYAGIVREMRWESESLIKSPGATRELAIVDPHLELYTGLEEGNPQPVPLRVLFYAETEAIKNYITLENRFLADRFLPPTHNASNDIRSVIVGLEPADYDSLRDFAYLQTDTRLDHTLVFQVDEFWAMRAPDRRKRAGAFQPLSNYLNAITAEFRNPPDAPTEFDADDYEPDPNVDPYALFQVRKAELLKEKPPPEQLRRMHFYEGYLEDFSGSEKPDLLASEHHSIDRFPFSWDFGFLLCQERAWHTDRTFQVNGETQTVRKVWDLLTKARSDRPKPASETPKSPAGKPDQAGKSTVVSWRLFIEACKKAAERQSDKISEQVTAFDFATISPESFSCLMLEMWLSEIYQSLTVRENLTERARLCDSLSHRDLFVPSVESRPEKITLTELLRDYWLEFYKCWLLLIEVLNFPQIIGQSSALDFDFRSKKLNFSAIASRHWYKTAAECPVEITSKEPLVPVRLPGHFSVRGDWFLAISGGSRSIRQAERALDLLNSRRANVTRLQMGMGLPTRGWNSSLTPGALSGDNSLCGLRTKLVSHEQGQDGIPYGTLLKLKAQGESNEFFWLWRSSLNDYAHWNRIWHKWLYRAILWWHRKLLRYKSVWISSFEVYDELTKNPPTRKKFAPVDFESLERIRTAPKREESLEAYTAAKSFTQLKVRFDFLKLLDILSQELDQACDVGHVAYETAQGNAPSIEQ